MPPPSLWSAWLPEHPALCCPGWVCVLQSRAVQHPEHTQGPAFPDQAQSRSALCGQLSSMCDSTMIYLNGFEIPGSKMTECRAQVAWNKRASSKLSFLYQAHWMDVSNSLILLPGRDVDEDMPALSHCGQKGFCVAPDQKQESIFTAHTAHQQGPKRHGVHGADGPLCPRAL